MNKRKKVIKTIYLCKNTIYDFKKVKGVNRLFKIRINRQYDELDTVLKNGKDAIYELK